MTTIESPTVEARLVPYRPFRNWTGSQACVPAHTMQAESERDVIDTVRYAIANRLSLRPIGSGLSYSPVNQTGGVLLDLSGLAGVTGVDTANRRVRVRAGTSLDPAASGGALIELVEHPST
jgi:FAD/FMN-containing dehydrogenase